MTVATRLRGQVAPLPADAPALGLYQVLGENGIAEPTRLPRLADAELVRMYRGMLTIRVMDERLLALQRQGRIGFYGEARGQEAAVIGAAAALGPTTGSCRRCARRARPSIAGCRCALRRADLRQRQRRGEGAAAALPPGHARGAAT